MTTRRTPEYRINAVGRCACCHQTFYDGAALLHPAECPEINGHRGVVARYREDVFRRQMAPVQQNLCDRHVRGSVKAEGRRPSAGCSARRELQPGPLHCSTTRQWTTGQAPGDEPAPAREPGACERCGRARWGVAAAGRRLDR
jgi:hypothetical protein